MRAIRICQKMKEEIENSENVHGYVHSAFNRACNIMTEDNRIYSLLSSDKAIAPLSVVLKLDKGFIDSGIAQGMEVTMDKKYLRINEANVEIDISKAKLWQGSPRFQGKRKVTEEGLINNLKIVEDSIFSSGRFEGIAPIVFSCGEYFESLKPFRSETVETNNYCSFIEDRFIRLFRNVIDNDLESFLDSIKNIIGFGPGLTPSTDDFIAGFMVGLIYLSNYYDMNISEAIQLNNMMIKDLDNKTTKISYKMLESAAIGEVSEDVTELLSCIFNKSTNNELKTSMLRVLDYGETSGTDTVCGIYSACRIMLKVENRGLLLNECNG